MRCRPAPSSTTSSTTTRYEEKLDELFAKEKHHEPTSEPARAPPSETQEVGRALRRGRRQHRALHGRPHRQRSALSRLRHPRHRRQLRVRGDRATCSCTASCPRLPSSPPTRRSSRLARDSRPVRETLERIPAATHPMDVMRTGVSALGGVLPERDDARRRRSARRRRPADGLASARCSSTGTTGRTSGKRIEVETDDDSIGGHFLHLLHGKPPSALWVRAMHTSLILYAEHEFNASTFTARVIAGHRLGHLFRDHRRDRRAARARSTAARTSSPSRCSGATRLPTKPRPTSAAASREGSHHRLRPSGVHHQRSAQPDDQGGRAPALRCDAGDMSMFDDRRAHRER